MFNKTTTIILVVVAIALGAITCFQAFADPGDMADTVYHNNLVILGSSTFQPLAKLHLEIPNNRDGLVMVYFTAHTWQAQSRDYTCTIYNNGTPILPEYLGNDGGYFSYPDEPVHGTADTHVAIPVHGPVSLNLDVRCQSLVGAELHIINRRLTAYFVPYNQ